MDLLVLFSIDMPHVVGWWPLQEAYGGRDLSGHGNHMTLSGVTFPNDDESPWSSPAAYFKSGDSGDIKNGFHLDVTSFSWAAKIYFVSNYDSLFSWQYNGAYGVGIEIYGGKLKALIAKPGCSTHKIRFGTAPTFRIWHTMAVTYDFSTNTIALWVDGVMETSTASPCGTGIKTSPHVNVGTGYICCLVLSIFYNKMLCHSLPLQYIT